MREKRKTHKPRQNELPAEQMVGKPRGAAGRAPPDGYSIQEAMGLRDDKRRYNAFCVSN